MGIIKGSIIGVSKGDTRSLDYIVHMEPQKGLHVEGNMI